MVDDSDTTTKGGIDCINLASEDRGCPWGSIRFSAGRGLRATVPETARPPLKSPAPRMVRLAWRYTAKSAASWPGTAVDLANAAECRDPTVPDARLHFAGTLSRRGSGSHAGLHHRVYQSLNAGRNRPGDPSPYHVDGGEQAAASSAPPPTDICWSDVTAHRESARYRCNEYSGCIKGAIYCVSHRLPRLNGERRGHPVPTSNSPARESTGVRPDYDNKTERRSHGRRASALGLAV